MLFQLNKCISTKNVLNYGKNIFVRILKNSLFRRHISSQQSEVPRWQILTGNKINLKSLTHLNRLPKLSIIPYYIYIYLRIQIIFSSDEELFFFYRKFKFFEYYTSSNRAKLLSFQLWRIYQQNVQILWQ